MHQHERVPFSPGPFPPPPPNFGPFPNFPPHHDTSVPPPNAFGHAVNGQAPNSPAQSYLNNQRKAGNFGGKPNNRNNKPGGGFSSGRGSNSGTPSSSPTPINLSVGGSGMNGISSQR